MRRLDDVALGMLRDLVSSIVAGRAQVVSLQAEEDEEHALAVRWLRSAAPADDAMAAPGPKPCPACGHEETWLTQHSTLVCPSCGHTSDT